MDDIFENVGTIEPTQEQEATQGTQTQDAPRKRHRRTKAEMMAARLAEAQAAGTAPTEPYTGDDPRLMPLTQAIYQIGLELRCGKSNTQHDTRTGRSFQYRSVEDILVALRPFKEKYGVFITFDSRPELVGTFNYITVKATIRNLRGEAFSVSSSAREDVERPGNWAAQISGSCESYAKKYCLQSLFMLDDSRLEPVVDPDAQEYTERGQQEQPERTEPRPEPEGDDGKPLLTRGVGDWMARVADAAVWTGTRDAFREKLLRNYRITGDDMEIMLASLPSGR